MLYKNKNQVAKFSLVWLEIAHGSSHPRISEDNLLVTGYPAIL